MQFEINYEGKTLSVDKIYTGTLDSGQKFEIQANWNEFDDWTVDDVTFESDDVDTGLKEEIIDAFLDEMND